MDELKIDAPKLPRELSELLLPHGMLYDEDVFREGVIKDCVIEQQNADRVTFDKVVLRNAAFAETEENQASLSGFAVTRLPDSMPAGIFRVPEHI
ncbi:hypothetical protein [Paenibacillus dendritiformis]|uniref:hypothetical protein n=1 Tax=Paenibacillus dendritiformis TaxID=130049 RepID=UPI0015EB398C|nr:hypothetical protein [Paenibacillus dendritiformis]